MLEEGVVSAAGVEALRRDAGALASLEPASLENGCVLEPLRDEPRDEKWRTDLDEYAAARAVPLSGVVREVLASQLAKVAASHLGCSCVYVFNEHFVVKPASSELEFRWHVDADLQLGALLQDQAEYVSCWVALDDSDESNGCLVVRDGRGERFMKCSAGDVVVLPSTLEHRSGPNSSNKSRRAYYAQYSAAPIVVGREQVLRLALPCGEEHGPLKKRRAEVDASTRESCLAEEESLPELKIPCSKQQHGVDAPTRELCLAESPELLDDLTASPELARWRRLERFAWGKLHDASKHWREVGAHWRHLYALSALGIARYRAEGALRTVDVGLMMDDCTFRAALLAEADRLHCEEEQEVVIELPAIDETEERICSGAVMPTLEAPSMEAFNACFSTGTPAKLTKAMAHWPALQRWQNLGYLKRVAGKRVVPVERGSHYLDENFEEVLVTLEDFIDQDVLTGSKAYLAQHALFAQIPRLRGDVCIPDYCAFGDHEPTLNAWLGPRHTKSPLHHDRDHNLLCQVVGSKYVRLYDKSHSEKLYPRSNADIHSISSQIADIDDVDDEKFPLFRTAPYTDTILRAGEMLYIPPHMWHYIESREISFSVSFWWS